ncbi:hypothetical protein EJB05_30901, partial [Eragrostis curvula]
MASKSEGGTAEEEGIWGTLCGRPPCPYPSTGLRYVRTTEHGGDEEVVVVDGGIPVVDLARLLDPQSSEEELRNLGAACQQGCFQLPLEAKGAYAQLPDIVEGYGQAFVLSETQKLDWADMIYLMLRPAEARNMRFWPASLRP